MAPKLNQILAVEKGIKVRTYSEITQIDKEMQKAALVSGIQRVYQPLADNDTEQLPPESTLVQVRVDQAIKRVIDLTAEHWDVTATKEWANTQASADIAIGDRVLVASAPVTYMLFLEKQLTDLRTMISRMPILDPAFAWHPDAASNAFATEVVQTHRTKKEPKVIIKYEATQHHPAQTELVTEDRIVGFWNTTKFSGAIPLEQRDAMMDRVDQLIKAVKLAREEANAIEVDNKDVAEPILNFLFNG